MRDERGHVEVWGGNVIRSTCRTGSPIPQRSRHCETKACVSVAVTPTQAIHRECRHGRSDRLPVRTESSSRAMGGTEVKNGNARDQELRWKKRYRTSNKKNCSGDRIRGTQTNFETAQICHVFQNVVTLFK